MGSGDYSVRDEVLPLGRTGVGMSGQVQRTDTRRAPAPTRFFGLRGDKEAKDVILEKP